MGLSRSLIPIGDAQGRPGEPREVSLICCGKIQIALGLGGSAGIDAPNRNRVLDKTAKILRSLPTSGDLGMNMPERRNKMRRKEDEMMRVHIRLTCHG